MQQINLVRESFAINYSKLMYFFLSSVCLLGNKMMKTKVWFSKAYLQNVEARHRAEPLLDPRGR